MQWDNASCFEFVEKSMETKAKTWSELSMEVKKKEIILNERTAHLASYTFLQEMLINIKTCQSHSSTNHQENLFHRTLITSYFRPVNIAKFSEHLFHRTPPVKQLFADVLQNRCSWKFSKLHKRALVLESLFKKPAGWRPPASSKKTPTKAFSCEVWKTFKSTFSYRIFPVAASVFF